MVLSRVGDRQKASASVHVWGVVQVTLFVMIHQRIRALKMSS